MKYPLKLWLPVPLIFYFFIILVTPLTHAQENINLKNQLATELKAQGLTGAVWSIIMDGEIHKDSWGIKNVDEHTTLNPDDLVHVGSLVKTVLATGILLLVTENKLTLDTPVEEILPEIKFENAWKTKVTVRHLLDQTSGMEDLRLWQIFSQKVTPSTPLLYAFSKDPGVLKLNTEPGSQYSYSNMGYTLLGLVIEKLSGERYEDFLDKNLLIPLGMIHSTFHFVEQVGPEADPNLALGHLDGRQTHLAFPINLRPAGQFTTNAQDMGLFMQFLLNGGMKEGKQLVSRNLIKSMGKVSGTDASLNGHYKGFSLGLAERDRHNVIGLYLSGAIVGYRAVIYLFPQHQKAFFIAVNMDSETANYENLNKIIIDHLNLPEEKQTAISKISKDFSDLEGVYFPKRTTIKAFKYIDLLTGFQTVEQKGEKIFIFPFLEDKKILHHVKDLLFRSQDRSSISHIFYKKNGTLYFVDGLYTYKKENRSYLIFLWFSFFVGLAGLVFTLVKGFKALLSRGTRFIKTSVAIPFLSTFLLLLPIPFFFLQSFVSLGDKTVASVLAALVTFILPFGYLYGMWRELIIMKNNKKFRYDLLALLSVIQLLLVLYYYGLIPLLLWV